MASRDRNTRCRDVAGVLLLFLFLSAKRVSSQQEESVPSDEFIQECEWTIMDRFVEAYGSTDWSAVAVCLVADPGSSGNPNVAFIPLSLGNVYLNRFERDHDVADFERALAWFEWVGTNPWLWGGRWLTAPVVSYLDISLVRLRGASAPGRCAGRVENLWQIALAITEREADGRLGLDYPPRPHDSSTSGDSKAEENAWEAGLLAAAANFLPEHGHAQAWDEKARQLAYDAITRPSDPPDRRGLKTSTVEDDFTMSNHGFFPNPTYAAATIELLAQAALTYRLSGKTVPDELQHNVRELYDRYRSDIDGDFHWVTPSDPAGEPALFPFAFDPDLEDRAIRCESDNGYLWQPTGPIGVMEVGAPLWTAVLNSKVVMFYLMGSYLWHFPPGQPTATR
jgi:hypothetical protein